MKKSNGSSTTDIYAFELFVIESQVNHKTDIRLCEIQRHKSHLYDRITGGDQERSAISCNTRQQINLSAWTQ